MSRNELCVYEAVNLDEADIVAAWLEEQGIEAILPDRHTTSTLGLPAIIPGGVDVCVANVEQLAQAKALIAEHQHVIAERLASAGHRGTIEVTCETCRKTFEVEAREAGRVVNCPHCQEYVDVPDPTASDEDDLFDEVADDEEE